MNIFNKNNENYIYSTSTTMQLFMSRVYGWMSCGLMLTSFVSWYIYNCTNLIHLFYKNQFFAFSLIFLQLFTIFCIYGMLDKLSVNSVISLFMFYSILTGFNLSIIFVLYTSFEIFISLFISSTMFIFMTAYGYITKNDLTSLGSLLIMLLFGIIISTFFNFYLQSEYLMWITSYASIFIFTGLIAYDTQRLKNLGNKLNYSNENLLNKYSILGALILYLDFINLFLIPLKMINKRQKDY